MLGSPLEFKIKFIGPKLCSAAKHELVLMGLEVKQNNIFELLFDEKLKSLIKIMERRCKSNITITCSLTCSIAQNEIYDRYTVQKILHENVYQSATTLKSLTCEVNNIDYLGAGYIRQQMKSSFLKIYWKLVERILASLRNHIFIYIMWTVGCMCVVTCRRDGTRMHCKESSA